MVLTGRRERDDLELVLMISGKSRSAALSLSFWLVLSRWSSGR